MIIERHLPTTLPALIDFVRSRVGQARSVAVQAGHFLLYYDHTEDQLIPCVASELSGPRQDLIRDTLGYFPSLTWNIGLSLLDALPAQEKRILVLVNDWQYIPKGVDRGRFYEQHPFIPHSYREALANGRTAVQLLTPPPLRKVLNTGDYFSEQTLRNQYRRHVRRLLSLGALPPNTEVSSNGSMVRCSLVDAVGRHQEVYCAGKSQNCTHEVAELLSLVSQLSCCDVFINLYPLVCRAYVEAGTELAFDLFHTPFCMILNVGMVATSARSSGDLLQSCEAVLQAPTQRSTW